MTDNEKIDTDFHDILSGLPVFTGGLRARLIKLASEARSDERQKVLAEVEGLINSGKGRETGVWHYEVNDHCEMEASYAGEYISLAELRAKLAEMRK